MRLLMIADDFTGALDAGVQFAKKGFKTNVLVADGVCMSQYEDTEILVIDAETRHREAKGSRGDCTAAGRSGCTVWRSIHI